MEHSFNGTAKASFNSFKERMDDIATVLNNSFVGITESIGGKNRSFAMVAQEGAEQTTLPRVPLTSRAPTRPGSPPGPEEERHA